jgi:hypothetical protein
LDGTQESIPPTLAEKPTNFRERFYETVRKIAGWLLDCGSGRCIVSRMCYLASCWRSAEPRLGA